MATSAFLSENPKESTGRRRKGADPSLGLQGGVAKQEETRGKSQNESLCRSFRRFWEHRDWITDLHHLSLFFLILEFQSSSPCHPFNPPKLNRRRREEERRTLCEGGRIRGGLDHGMLDHLHRVLYRMFNVLQRHLQQSNGERSQNQEEEEKRKE